MLKFPFDGVPNSSGNIEMPEHLKNLRSSPEMSEEEFAENVLGIKLSPEEMAEWLPSSSEYAFLNDKINNSLLAK
jgi:hypothetical protein